MMDGLSILPGLLKNRPSGEKGRLCAFVLAPSLVVGLAFAGGQRAGSLFDLSGPIAITELRTEMSVDGRPTPRKGIAVILEPTAAESHISLKGDLQRRVWSSLSESGAEANRDRLVLSRDGLSSKTPLNGVSSPVTLVVEGELGSGILIPGGVQSIASSTLSSRRSQSLLSSVLFSCVLAFGMALASAVPSPVPSEKDRRNVRA